MPIACPKCESAIDPDRLNAAAQTAECEQCGEVCPRVSIPTFRDGTPDGNIAGWQFTWKPDEHGMNVIASLPKERLGILAYVLGMVTAVTALVDLGGQRNISILFCGLFVALGAFERWPVTVRLARDRVTVKTRAIRSVRSVPTDDVFQFKVVRVVRGEGAGTETFAVAMHVGFEQITIWACPAGSAAHILSNRLNEALFLVLAPRPSAPYR